jgi:hypothetical protein
MAEVNITTTPGINIQTRLDNIYACCISAKFNNNPKTPRIFIASSPKDITTGFTIRYADYNDNSWNAFTAISNSREDTINQGWTAMTSTTDGTRLAVSGMRGYIYMATWNGNTNSYSELTRVKGYTLQDIVYSGIKMTGDGSRLVVMAIGGNLWCSTWDGSSNYVSPTTNVRLPSTSDTNFAMATNGSRIVYADASNNLYMLTWNGNTYANNTKISNYTAPTLSTYRALEFSGDMRVLYATTNFSNTLSYFVWDKTANNYNIRKTYDLPGMPIGSYNKTAIGIVNPSRSRSTLYIVDSFNRTQNILYNYNTYIYAPTPIYDISFDLPNTNFVIPNQKTVDIGNLQVSINDDNNSIVNNLYYLYSMDGVHFINSNVMADSGTSPYQFNVRTPDISNTIYIKADDTFGNASNVSSTQVTVYQIPRVPPILQLELVGSGNLKATVGENDGVSTIPNYYYLNEVTYISYLYSSGINLSYDIEFYTTILGNSSPSNSIYANTITYISELTENTYTLYLAARNIVGLSPGINTQTITVYTATKYAPTIDSANTISTTSGNLLVSIIDTSNSNINNIYYLYSLDGGITYGNSGVAHNGNGHYSFTVSDTGNSQIPLIANTYSLSIIAINQYGNMTSIPQNVSVYTTPIAPIIDSANTVSKTSGNLTVSIIDNFNTAINSVYYLYSLDGGITYGNSGITNNGNTQYSFTVSDTGNAQIPLIANTYTLSVQALNTVGNAYSLDANFSVYTTPLAITTDNTYAVSFNSGEFTVVFFDTFNAPINQVYYLISIDGGNTYANTGIACIGVPSHQYTYILTTEIARNSSFNTYIKASNTVGNSSAIQPIPYTIPDSPVLIDTIAGNGSATIVFQGPDFYGGNAISRYEYSSDNGNHFLSMNVPPFIDINSNIMSYTTTFQSNGTDVLVNGELYPITLRAVNARGISANISNTIYVMPFSVPDAPTLNGVIAGNQVIDISFTAPAWDGGNSITQYQYSIDNNKSFTSIPDAVLGNHTNTYRIEGLENGNVYSVSVRTRNFSGNSAPSNIFSNIVPFGIPDAPVLWTMPQNRTIQVSFVTPNNRGREITQYKYSVDGGNIFANVVPFPTSNLMSGTTTFSIYNVKNGREYPLNVISVNSIGESPISSRVYTTPKTVPDEPTIQEIIPMDGGVDIVFSPPENIGGNAITAYTYGYVLGMVFDNAGTT